jgi:hypothetical protein
LFVTWKESGILYTRETNLRSVLRSSRLFGSSLHVCNQLTPFGVYLAVEVLGPISIMSGSLAREGGITSENWQYKLYSTYSKTRRVPLMEQEMSTLPEHLSSTPVFWIVVCPFLLAIVLSVLLRFTDSYNPFVIFKLFFQMIRLMS